MAPVAPAQPDVDGNPDSSAFIRIPKDTDDWTRHFRIGALVGMNISANFNQNGLFNISGNNPANGIYDDGYVRPDQNGDPNYTSYWGYNNASQQYDPAHQQLTMHSSSSYSTTGGGREDGGAFPGFEMAYGGNLWYWKHARVGWEFGFGLLPVDISEDFNAPATVTQSTYTFSTRPWAMSASQPLHPTRADQAEWVRFFPQHTRILTASRVEPFPAHKSLT